MKKLMIAAAIVCAAVVSQAASMYWGQSANKIYMPDTANGGAWSEDSLGSNGTGYLFELTKTQYEALFVEGDYAASAANVFNNFATVKDDGTISITGATDSKKSSTSKIKNFTDSRTFFTDGADKTAYAAMIITTTGADGKDYYIANIASYEFASPMDGEIANMGAYEFGLDTNNEITGWTTQDVPEPTSGLLLLLGVAGLALKRLRRGPSLRLAYFALRLNRPPSPRVIGAGRT